MKTVIIMQGNVGVGKSTLARAIQKKIGLISILSRDGIRHMIHGGEYKFDQTKEFYIKKLFFAILKESLDSFTSGNDSIIIDGVNSSNVFLTDICTLADNNYKKILVVFLDLDKEKTMRRLFNRKGFENISMEIWENVYDGVKRQLVVNKYDDDRKNKIFDCIIRLEEYYNIVDVVAQIEDAINNSIPFNERICDFYGINKKYINDRFFASKIKLELHNIYEYVLSGMEDSSFNISAKLSNIITLCENFDYDKEKVI